MIKSGESGHPVFRVTSPFSRGTLKSKGGGKLSLQFCADVDTIETVFRTIISVNQLSIYGAVSDLCEEYGTCQTRTGGTVLAGESDPLFEPSKLLIMTPRLSIEFPAQEILLQEHQERVDKASTTRSIHSAFLHFAEPVTQGHANPNRISFMRRPSMMEPRNPLGVR